MMDFSNLIPPHNLIAERQVLSSMLLNDDTLYRLIGELSSEHFYNAIHGQIFNSMKNYKTKDISTLSLHVSEPETLIEIAGLYADCDCSKSVDELNDALIRREGIKANLQSAMALQNDFETPPEKTLNKVQSKIAQICMGDSRSQPEPVSAILPRVFDGMQRMHERRKSGSGFIGTGIKKLDSFLVFDNSDLIVIGGRPRMGKSAFASHMVRHNAKQGKTIAVFSCEMSKEQECKRELFSEAELNMHSYNLGTMPMRDIPKLSFAAGPLSDRKIYIDSQAGTTPAQVIAKCNYVKAIAGLDMIVFDFLQMSGSDRSFRSRQEEVSTLAREYKNIAVQFNVPFFLLSQLSRASEDSQDKKPGLRHLKESGGIEEAANTIIFVHREWPYMSLEEKEKHPEKVNITNIICGKQRDGESDIETEIFSDLSIGKYADLEQMESFDYEDNGSQRY